MAESIRAQDPDFFSHNEASHMMEEVGFSFQSYKIYRGVLWKNGTGTYQTFTPKGIIAKGNPLLDPVSIRGLLDEQSQGSFRWALLAIPWNKSQVEKIYTNI